MGFEIWKPSHLKIGQIVAIFVKNHSKSEQKLLDFIWSGFQMVGTIALALPSSKSLDFQMFLDFE